MNDWVLVSPAITNAGAWIRGRIIDIEDNSFRGTVITVETEDGTILWEEEKYFKPVS